MLSFSLGGVSPYPVHIHNAWKQGKKLAEIYKNFKELNNKKLLNVDDDEYDGFEEYDQDLADDMFQEFIDKINQK